ncbi:MAG: PASTA domain-containing protein [Solirubrobacteraceae bacterium]
MTKTVTAPAAPAPTPTEATPEEPEPQSEPVAKKIEVPDVVGENHQDAQDRMQAEGLYNLREKDATGLDRLLLLDSNWEVVSQKPAAGKRVSENATITLSSKKIGE